MGRPGCVLRHCCGRVLDFSVLGWCGVIRRLVFVGLSLGVVLLPLSLASPAGAATGTLPAPQVICNVSGVAASTVVTCTGNYLEYGASSGMSPVSPFSGNVNGSAGFVGFGDGTNYAFQSCEFDVSGGWSFDSTTNQYYITTVQWSVDAQGVVSVLGSTGAAGAVSVSLNYGASSCNDGVGGNPAGPYITLTIPPSSPPALNYVGNYWIGNTGYNLSVELVQFNGESAPCTLDSVSGPQVSMVNLSYSFATAGTIAAVFFQTENSGSSAPPAGTPLPSSYVASGGPNSLPGFLVTAPGQGNFTTYFDFQGLSGFNDLEMYCLAGGSSWISWGSIDGDTGNALVPQSGSSSLAVCLASSGLSLDPTSWVPALWNMGSCVLQWLFVPSQSAVDGLTSQFNGSGGSASNWIGSISALFVLGPTTTFQTMQTDFGAPASNSLLDTSITVAGVPKSVPAVNVSDALGALTSSPQVHPYIGLVVDLLTAALLVLFFYYGVRFFWRLMGWGSD